MNTKKPSRTTQKTTLKNHSGNEWPDGQMASSVTYLINNMYYIKYNLMCHVFVYNNMYLIIM